MYNISNTKAVYRKSKTSIGYKTKKGDIYLLCPFHGEKTPSCVIHTRTHTYFHCYGCGKSGGLRELERKIKIPMVNRNRGNTIFYDNWELDNPELPW